jgi:hypothetical protein
MSLLYSVLKLVVRKAVKENNTRRRPTRILSVSLMKYRKSLS